MIGSHVLVLGAGTDGLAADLPVLKTRKRLTSLSLLIQHKPVARAREAVRLDRYSAIGSVISLCPVQPVTPQRGMVPGVRATDSPSTDGLSFFRSQQDRLRNLR